jgi:hypothetical protein
MELIHRDLKERSMLKAEFDNGEVYAPRVCATRAGVIHLRKRAEEYVKVFTDSYNAQPFKGKVAEEGEAVVLTRRVKTPSVLVLEVTAR